MLGVTLCHQLRPTIVAPSPMDPALGQTYGPGANNCFVPAPYMSPWGRAVFFKMQAF